MIGEENHKKKQKSDRTKNYAILRQKREKKKKVFMRKLERTPILIIEDKKNRNIKRPPKACAGD